MTIRSDLAERLAALSRDIFSQFDNAAPPWEQGSVSCKSLPDAESHDLFSAFRSSAEDLLGVLSARKLEVVELLASALQLRELSVLSTVSRHGWAIAWSPFLFAELHVTQPLGRRLLLNPVYYAYLNISGSPLRGHMLPIGGPIEHVESLDFCAAIPFETAPGEMLTLDGNRFAHWFEGARTPVFRISSSFLASYEAVFDTETGRRLTLASADLAVGRVETLLRLFAAARDGSVIDIAQRLTGHRLRELRWVALNYMHRLGSQEAIATIGAMTADPDARIRRLAETSLRLQSERTAHATG
jgi:hypothetical protein